MKEEKYTNIKLGKDLRKFTIELLDKQEKIPKLIDYLASLWSVAEYYKNIEKINFAQIAEILEKAFIATPKKINWKSEKKKLKFKNDIGENMTDYERFEKIILTQLIELKSFEGLFAKSNSEWKNLDTKSYLERGTIYYYEDEELEADWTDINNIIHEGKYNE